MTILSIFVYNLKSVFRDLKTNGVVVILPIIFMAVFGLIFGSEKINEQTINLGLYQESSSESSQFSPNPEILAQVFQKITEEENNLIIKTTNYSSSTKMLEDLESKKIDLGLEILNSPQTGPAFQITANYNNIYAQNQVLLINPILSQFLLEEPLPIGVNFEGQKLSAQESKPFNFLATGLIIYGLLIMIPLIAQRFTKITEKFEIIRYSNSKTSSFELIFGNVLFYMFLGCIQTVALYTTAQFFGYSPNGSLLLALVPITLTLLFVVAVGLLVGGLFKKSEGANNTGIIISIVLGFLSGSFIVGVENLWRFDLFGKNFGLVNFVPTSYSNSALTKVLTETGSLADISTQLWVLGISGVLALSLSILVYSKMQLNKFE